MITRVLNRTRPAAWLMIVVMWLAACGGNGGADNDGGAGSPATGIGSAGGADNDGGADSPATGNEDTGGADNDGGANSPADGNGSAGGNDNDGNGGVEPPAANRAPEAQPFCNTTVQGESLTAMLQASDTEDDPLTYSFNTASASPAQTRLETDAGVVTLDPETGQFT